MYSGRTKILRLLFIADKYDSNEANLNAGAHEVAGRLVKGREKSSDASRSLSLSLCRQPFISLSLSSCLPSPCFPLRSSLPQASTIHSPLSPSRSIHSRHGLEPTPSTSQNYPSRLRSGRRQRVPVTPLPGLRSPSGLLSLYHITVNPSNPYPSHPCASSAISAPGRSPARTPSSPTEAPI